MSNLVTLIAEVSGFADMFMIFGTLLLGTLNQARMKSVLASLMPPLEFPNPKRPQDKPRHTRLLSQVMSYKHLKESIIHSLCTAWCSRRFLNRRQRKVLRLKTKQVERADLALDIRNIVKSQEDLCMLLRHLMTTEQRWLFKWQQKRVISIDRGPILRSDSSDNDKT